MDMRVFGVSEEEEAEVSVRWRQIICCSLKWRTEMQRRARFNVRNILSITVLRLWSQTALLFLSFFSLRWAFWEFCVQQSPLTQTNLCIYLTPAAVHVVIYSNKRLYVSNNYKNPKEHLSNRFSIIEKKRLCLIFL